MARWESAWLETQGPWVWASPATLHCGPWARHIYPSLVLVQPRNTHPCVTERFLMGRKESNQTNILHAAGWFGCLLFFFQITVFEKMFLRISPSDCMCQTSSGDRFGSKQFAKVASKSRQFLGHRLLVLPDWSSPIGRLHEPVCGASLTACGSRYSGSCAGLGASGPAHQGSQFSRLYQEQSDAVMASLDPNLRWVQITATLESGEETADWMKPRLGTFTSSEQTEGSSTVTHFSVHP